MATKIQRAKFVEALNNMDAAWMRFLADEAFYDINYSDLFTGLWRAGEPVRKLDAVAFIRHLGPQTAMKYVNRAIEKGFVVASPDPNDGRAQLLSLSEDLRSRLESFFDEAIMEFETVFR